MLLFLTQSSDPQGPWQAAETCESQHRWPVGLKEHKDAHNRKNSLLYSSLDHHQFGKIFLVLPSEEELLVMLSPLLLKLGKLQSGSGRCCWGCPCAAGGLAVGRGWRALFITCPTCLWLDLIWPPRLISVTWSLLWSCGSLLDLCFMCSAQTHWTAYNVLVIGTGMKHSRNLNLLGFSCDTSLCGDKVQVMEEFFGVKKNLTLQIWKYNPIFLRCNSCCWHKTEF